MSDVRIITEDYCNRAQSWTFAGVYRIGDGVGAHVVRVEIRANAYREQSHAMVSAWGRDGWRFHTALPVAEWYDLLPSYTRKALTDEDGGQFRWLAGELLERYCYAIFGATEGLKMLPPERRSEYEDAITDGVIPSGTGAVA